MTEPNYNDGKWHGWNGGECPVHPETVVDAMTRIVALPCSKAGRIGGWELPHDNPIIAFRVTKEHCEPREWWCVLNNMHSTIEAAEKFRADLDRDHPRSGWLDRPIIHVREVL
mgnify:CR=1 FL=1